MGVKNSHIHLSIETSIKERVKLEAFEEGITMAEFCRKRIRETAQLTRMELMLQRLLKRKY